MAGAGMKKMNPAAFAQIVLHLDGDHSCAELAEISGLHYVTVLHYTRSMHRVGAVHIAAWEKDSRNRDAVKLYKLGRGKDKRREKLTSAERAQRSRAARKHRVPSVFGHGAIAP